MGRGGWVGTRQQMRLLGTRGGRVDRGGWVGTRGG